MKIKYAPLLMMLLAAGCASKKLKPVDEVVDVKATMGDHKTIGLNADDDAIIEEGTPVEDALRKATWLNYETERKLKQEREDLIRCRTDLADPRLSGNKTLEKIPELEISRDLTKVQEKLGITKAGRIKVVKKEYLVDRMEKEQRYKDSLDNLLQVLTDSRTTCERELGYARVEKGLPSTRYPAEGHNGPNGNFIVTREAEKNLDDAFRILAKQTRKGARQERAEKRMEPATPPATEDSEE